MLTSMSPELFDRINVAMKLVRIGKMQFDPTDIFAELASPTDICDPNTSFAPALALAKPSALE